MTLTLDMERQFNTFIFIELKHDAKRKSHYASMIRVFFSFFADKEFSRSTFNEFIEYLLNKGLQHSTINLYIALGKNFDKFQKTDHLKNYKSFKVDKKITYPLSPDDIKHLSEVDIAYIRRKDYLNRMYYYLITFLGTTGCRIEEALNLTKADLHDSPYGITFRDTKNNSPRFVPIADWIYEGIYNLNDNGLIFQSYRGGKLTLQAVNLDLKRRAVKCKINKRIYCHLFRHSYITTMLEQGTNIDDVAILVGHKDLQTTMMYKNSMVQHYVEVAYTHPLLRSHLTLDTISERMKKVIDNLVDKTKYISNVTESSEVLSISIKKMYN